MTCPETQQQSQRGRWNGGSERPRKSLGLAARLCALWLQCFIAYLSSEVHKLIKTPSSCYTALASFPVHYRYLTNVSFSISFSGVASTIIFRIFKMCEIVWCGASTLVPYALPTRLHRQASATCCLDARTGASAPSCVPTLPGATPAS